LSEFPLKIILESFLCEQLDEDLLLLSIRQENRKSIEEAAAISGVDAALLRL
jgi:hypothetical protein